MRRRSAFCAKLDCAQLELTNGVTLCSHSSARAHAYVHTVAHRVCAFMQARYTGTYCAGEITSDSCTSSSCPAERPHLPLRPPLSLHAPHAFMAYGIYRNQILDSCYHVAANAQSDAAGCIHKAAEQRK